MNLFKTKYRVVTDAYCGFEAQFKYWWSPIWRQTGGTNTSATLEEAITYSVPKKVVWTST